ncbi:MAG: hypothetical protein K2L88_01845 [Clostridiales bacterium]|nr:hypothetical protein [Clostridiales bacterium]
MATEGMSERERRRAIIDNRARELDEKVDADRKEQEIAEKRRKFSERRQELEDRAVQLTLERGREDYLTQMLTMFLDVTIQMEDLISTLNDVSKAMLCITEAMTCMDSILETTYEALDETTKVSHSWRERRKKKKKIQRAMRNNEGRMIEIVNMLESTHKMAFGMQSTFQKSTARMQAKLAKQAAKQRKIQEKQRKNNGGVEPMPSRAQQLIDKRVSEASDGNGAGGGEGSAPVGGTAPNAGGASTGAYDDIL